MPVRALDSLPLRDAASRHLLDRADGSPLYPAGAFASAAAVEKRARKLAEWKGDRKALAAWLKEQNSFATPHAAQSEALAAAADPNSLFVLTGQQPGLLGGPALWFYKALTCLAWARECARILKRPVIPIFWVAGDDSDLAECNAVEILDPGAAASSLSLEFPDPEAAIPMSLRPLPAEGLTGLFDTLAQSWSAEALDRARDAYRPGRSVTEGFLHLAQSFLGSEGVLFVDGFSATQRAQGLLARIVRGSAEFHGALERGTKRLRETLSQPPQVPVRPGAVPVFLLEEGRRVRLFASDSGRVYAQGDEGRDRLPDLAALSLSHSALTRPLVVEELFPALGHVLGPAELRYFAQIADVFPAFGFSFPLLAPRQQALVVSDSGLADLEALGIGPPDLPDIKPSAIRERLTTEAWEGHEASGAFPDPAYQAFRDALKQYQDRWFREAGFEAAQRRLDRAFGHYREQARRQVFAREASEKFRSLQPLLRWLGNGAQDRHLNVLSLRNALGEEGFAELRGRLGDPGAAVRVLAWKDASEG